LQNSDQSSSQIVEPQTSFHSQAATSNIVQQSVPTEQLQTLEQNDSTEQIPKVSKTEKKVTKKTVKVAKNIGVRENNLMAIVKSLNLRYWGLCLNTVINIGIF